MFEGLFSDSLRPDSRVAALRPTKGVVIGAGAVGMAIAYGALIKGQFSELVLIDVNKERLEGEVMDLNQASAFTSECVVRSGEIADCADASVVVVTAGAAQKPGETRIDLVQRNVEILKSIIPGVAKAAPDAIIILVSNPVDVITYVAQRLSGLPPSRVIGSGTVLDTGRFRVLLSERLGVSAHSIHGYILGEHGDTEFPFWSAVTVGGSRITDCKWEGSPTSEDPELDQLVDRTRYAAYEIIKRKGYTSWAIGLATCEIIEAVLGDEQRVMPVSVLLNGEFGLDDVCLAVPAVVGRQGATRVVKTVFRPKEQKALEDSAAALKEVIAGIKW